MGIAYNTSIVRSGLILHLDAANVKSYPGSGTTWFDLSGNSANGSFGGDPSFITDSFGTFSFDGTGDEILLGNDSLFHITEGTIGSWFNSNVTNSGYNGIIAKQRAWGLFVLDDVLVAYSWVGGLRSTGINVFQTGWHHVMMTFTETTGTPSDNAIIYLDAEPVLTTTIIHSDHNRPLNIGDANASQNFSGLISTGYIYDRVLSANEVSQNFEALRGRYGI